MTGQRPRGSASADAIGAPVHPADFWEQPQLRAAARERHFGRLLRAYRVVQTPPVQQTQLAGWLGITQGQLRRIERAVAPVRDLVKLDQWARMLHIPAHLLWFDVSPNPSETPAAPPLGATLAQEPDQGEDDDVRRRDLLKITKAGAAAAGVLLCAGALSARVSIWRAGFGSAADPRYVVGPQRRRIGRGERAGASRTTPRLETHRDRPDLPGAPAGTSAPA